ncbi:MAG: AzlC family ABC transporter permease [Shimia sp.]
MPTARPRSPFTHGLADGAPFLLVIVPFALLFGVVATEAGLPIFQTLMFSVVVIAGTAQFTAIQLMQEGAPAVLCLAMALLVNLRMAMYSAALAPHLGAAPLWHRALIAYLVLDQSFACASTAYEARRAWTLREKLAYFWGCVLLIFPAWYVFTLVGAWLGEGLPVGLGLDFALPLCFIAILAPALRTAAHVAAAGTSVAVALALAWVPFQLGLIAAAIAAMAVGARVELWQAARVRI